MRYCIQRVSASQVQRDWQVGGGGYRKAVTSAAASPVPPAPPPCCLASAFASSAALDCFRRFFRGFSSPSWLAAADVQGHTGERLYAEPLCTAKLTVVWARTALQLTLTHRHARAQQVNIIRTFADVQAAKGQVAGGRGGGGGSSGTLGCRLLSAAERLIHLRQLPAAARTVVSV